MQAIDPNAINQQLQAWGQLVLSGIGILTAIAIALIGGYFSIRATATSKAAHDKADTNGADIRDLNKDVKAILASLPPNAGAPPPSAPQSAPAPTADVTINNNAPDTTDTGSEAP